MANLRAAKAAAVTLVLNGDPGEDAPDKDAYDALLGTTGAFYDAQAGVLVGEKPAKGYLKGTTQPNGNLYTASNNEYGYVSATSYENEIITVKYTPETATDAAEFTFGHVGED